MEPNKFTLALTVNLRLEQEYERVTLWDLVTGKSIFADEHYGDAKKAIIGPGEDWCVIGGEGISVWKKDMGLIHMMRSPIMFIHDLKMDDQNKVKILVDPWSTHASVWILDVERMDLTKLKDGPSLTDQPYSEHLDF